MVFYVEIQSTKLLIINYCLNIDNYTIPKNCFDYRNYCTIINNFSIIGNLLD